MLGDELFGATGSDEADDGQAGGHRLEHDRGERILARAEEERVGAEVELRDVLLVRNEVDPVSNRTAGVGTEPALGVAVEVPDPDEVQVVGSRGRELCDVDERIDALSQVAESDVEHDA